jgi:hypothetical protein
MNSCKKICDGCGKEVNTGTWFNTPEKWRRIEVKLGQYTSKDFDLCPECLEKFGFEVDRYGDIKSNNEEPIEKKLCNMFIEIAQMAAGGNE